MIRSIQVMVLLAAAWAIAAGCAAPEKKPSAGKGSGEKNLTAPSPRKERPSSPVIPGISFEAGLKSGTETISAAGEDVTVPVPLHGEEAVKIALQRSPNIHAAAARILAAEARIGQARAGYLPTIDFSGNATRNKQNFAQIKIPGVDLSSRYWSYEAALTGKWILFDGLAREARFFSSKSNWRESLAAYDDARRLLVQAVETAFNNALLAREQCRIAEGDASFNEKLLKETRSKVAAGSASLSDRLNFEIRLNQAKAGLTAARRERRIASAVLAELMGIGAAPPPEGFVLAPLEGEKETDLADADEEAELSFALKNRPDLESLRYALEAAKSQVEQNRAGYFPTLFLQGYYGYQRLDNAHFNRDDLVMTASLNLAWNLFNGLSDAAGVKVAEELTREQRNTLAAKWLSVISEVRQSLADLTSAKEQLRLQEENARLTRKTRDLVLDEYRAGQESLVRLNEAQHDLITAEGNFALARIALRQALSGLEAATARNIR